MVVVVSGCVVILREAVASLQYCAERDCLSGQRPTLGQLGQAGHGRPGRLPMDDVASCGWRARGTWKVMQKRSHALRFCHALEQRSRAGDLRYTGAGGGAVA